MFIQRIAKLIKLSVLALTISMLLFGFLCAGMFSGASMNAAMDMGVTSSWYNQQCCSLGVGHNVDSWKNIILIIPNKMRSILDLLALGSALIIGCALVSLRNRQLSSNLGIGRLRIYLREHPNIALFNHLKLALARGVLNPKVF